jgi:hypothetical protein
MTKDNAGQRADSRRPSLRPIDNPHRLTKVELGYLELVAKGFGSSDASRLLGIGSARATQLVETLVHKLQARDPEHFRQLATDITGSRPSERFVVLDC